MKMLRLGVISISVVAGGFVEQFANFSQSQPLATIVAMAVIILLWGAMEVLLVHAKDAA